MQILFLTMVVTFFKKIIFVGLSYFGNYILLPNPIQDDWRGKKALYHLTSSFPEAVTNVKISPQNFLAFHSNSLTTVVKTFKTKPGSNLKVLNLNQDHSSKKLIFLVKV